MQKLNVASLLFAAVTLVSCGGEGTTLPTGDYKDPVITQTTPTITVVNPTFTPTPAPEAKISYVTLNLDGSGVFCAIKGEGSSHTIYVFYTIPGRNDAASTYGIKTFSTAYGTCTDLPPANQTGIRFPWCGKEKVQVDVALGSGSGPHIGHVFAQVSSEATCECKPEWVEQEPVITYSEWGECHVPEQTGTSRSRCAAAGERHRTKTTTINEVNSCTQESRVKSTSSTQETAPCVIPVTCPTPEPTYGYCHVSNKGHDGDWNLEVSYKQDGEGHEKHLDASKFCPPDYKITVPTEDSFTQQEKDKENTCEVVGSHRELCSCTYPDGTSILDYVKEHCEG